MKDLFDNIELEQIQVNVLERTNSNEKEINEKNLKDFEKIDNNYFPEKSVEMEKLLSEKTSVENIKEINELIDEILVDCKKNIRARKIIEILKHHQNNLESEVFEWIYFHKDLQILQPFLNFFELFQNFTEKLIYLNFTQIRKLLPIIYFENYFKKQFYSEEDDLTIYPKIHTFTSSLLSIFNLLYIKSFLSIKPTINAEKIISIDPYMRTTIRKENILYYMNNFPEKSNFNLYSFLKNFINRFVLTGSPKWYLNEGTPIIVPLFEFINTLFKYGLVSYKFSQELLGLIYLVCDTIVSLERKLDSFSKKTLIEKFIREFIICKENVSLILIHIVSLFNDIALEETQIQKGNENNFSKFIFKEISVYNYFSHIVLKYLSQKLLPSENNVESILLNENLSLIFNFIGDFQNDFFVTSMDLINKENFEYYFFEVYDKIDLIKKDQYDDSRIFHKNLLSFLEQIKNQEITEKNKIECFKNFLNQIEPIVFKNENDIFFKLECAKKNNIALFLAILDLVDDGGEENKNIIIRAIILLQILVKNCYPSQGIFFRDNSKKHFQSILQKRNFMLIMMLKEVFRHNSELIYISDKIFYNNLKKYKEYLLEFEQNFLNDDELSQNRAHIIKLFYYNEFFFNLIELHKVSIKQRKKFDIVIAQEIYKIFHSLFYNFSAFFEKFDQLEIENITLKSVLTEINLRNLIEKNEILNCVPLRTLKRQIFFNLFKLFNKATYRVYSGEIFKLIYPIAHNGDKVENFPVKSFEFPDSILLRLEYIKLMDRFKIFYPNHLITQRAKENPNPDLFIGENLLQDFLFVFDYYISTEFAWYEKYMNYHKKKNEQMLKNIRKYLLKGLIAMIFKFLKGVQCQTSLLLKNQDIKDIFEVVHKIVDQLSTVNSQFERLLKNNVTEKVMLKQERKNLIKQKLYASSKSKSLILENFEFNFKEERPFPTITELRKNLNKGLNLISNYYEDKKFSYLIERYERVAKKENNEYFNEKYSSSLMFFNDLNIGNYNYSAILVNKYEKIFLPLKKDYLKMKCQFLKNHSTNHFYMVLNDNRDKLYIKTFLYYFIEQISSIQIDFSQNNMNYDRNCFLNDFFINLIIIVDNLMRWNPNIRIIFMEVLEKEQVNKAQIMFNKLWSFFLLLYLIVMYKTFNDLDWTEYWSQFVVLSKFLENLCEKNNQSFKLYFNKINGAISQFTSFSFDQNNYSIFFELYILLETSVNFSNSWLNTAESLLPSDKPEMFQIFQRLMDHTTELIVGPCLENQLKIYVYRIDIWCGIIRRVISDTDSDFYKLKLSCVNYISGLLEGLDDNIVTFMGSNLQIGELFEIIIRLIKKLYIRLNRIIALKKNQDKTNLSIVTLEDEKQLKISNLNELLDHYFIYEDDFSNHILLDNVVQIYFLLQDLSLKFKFFKMFLNEKEEEKWKNMKEENIIIRFVKKITCNIEIIYKDELKRIYFKKNPQCFLLSKPTKLHFITNVDNTTIQTKHTDLFENVTAFELEMTKNRKYYMELGGFFAKTKLSNINLLNNIISQIEDKMPLIIYFLSVFLNLLMLLFYDASHVDNQTDYNIEGLQKDGYNRYVIKIIAILICIATFLNGAIWIYYQSKLHYDINYKFTIKKKSSFGKYLFDMIFLNDKFSFNLYMFSFTLVGIIYWDWFFTLNLFLINELSKTASYILQSIYKHYEKLIISIFLTILIIYSYSFLFVNYFTKEIKTNNFGEDVCKDFLNCFFNSINWGVRMGGGLSDFLFLISRPEEEDFWYRFVFDVTFFIFIQLISLNIFSGIIIDTFSDMRDELTFRQYNEKNVCFICGSTRWQIEKRGKDFSFHRDYEHNIWDYLSFMIKLKKEDQHNFDGVENYIYEKFKNDDSSWLPKSN